MGGIAVHRAERIGFAVICHGISGEERRQRYRVSPFLNDGGHRIPVQSRCRQVLADGAFPGAEGGTLQRDRGGSRRLRRKLQFIGVGHRLGTAKISDRQRVPGSGDLRSAACRKFQLRIVVSQRHLSRGKAVAGDGDLIGQGIPHCPVGRPGKYRGAALAGELARVPVDRQGDSLRTAL